MRINFRFVVNPLPKQITLLLSPSTIGFCYLLWTESLQNLSIMPLLSEDFLVALYLHAPGESKFSIWGKELGHILLRRDFGFYTSFRSCINLARTSCSNRTDDLFLRNDVVFGQFVGEKRVCAHPKVSQVSYVNSYQPSCGQPRFHFSF